MAKSIPRSLRVPSRTPLNRKGRVATARRNSLTESIRTMRRSNIGKRRRQIGAISDLFFSAGGRNLYDEIGKRVKAGNCSIFEIGSGFGVGLKGIQRHWQRKGYALQISGIDIFSNEGRGRKFANIRTGNALSKPFPKADIIFSLYTLGYI
ncbi:MAG: hypothetical protein Q7R47_06775 [Candidatus Diapherotrites archaeon]|nr:hypothetical protein [Candidatus Diapherotrites archaeon]